MDVIVGTAGHIDHGKTALVKALTGVDADRLPEEKQRGITIDLGFAELRVGETRVGFVDVPGHERFVKNMLAGASGIDIVLLVIAADEGVMPQTSEHFDICRLLQIRNGLIVLTKVDLVDAETLELAKLDAAELVAGSFLENAPAFAVSSKSGDGIEQLRAGLIAAAESVERETDIRDPRLAIDRSFSVKGFGAVVTGTLASGVIAEGMELELYPDPKPVRVRGIQSHGRSSDQARAGQRTAINLAGVTHEDVRRGMVLAAPGSLTVTQSVDAEVEILADSPRPLKSRQRVRLHLGTEEVLARVSVLNDRLEIEPGARDFVQFRLEAPVAASHADRFIIRSYSPQRTIGGGRILDPASRRHRRSELESVRTALGKLAGTERNLFEVITQMSGVSGVRLEQVRSRTGLRYEVLREQMQNAVSSGTITDAGGVYISSEIFNGLRAAALSAIETHHRGDKLSRGLSREALRDKVFKRVEPEVFRSVTSLLEREGKISSDHDVFKLASYEVELSPAESKARDHLRLRYAGLDVPKLEEALSETSKVSGLDAGAVRKVFQLLVNKGELVGVTSEFYFSTGVVDELKKKLRESGDTTIDVGRFKEIAGVSRKYAIPLLEFFDRTKVTVRVGDKRKVI